MRRTANPSGVVLGDQARGRADVLARGEDERLEVHGHRGDELVARIAQANTDSPAKDMIKNQGVLQK